MELSEQEKHTPVTAFSHDASRLAQQGRHKSIYEHKKRTNPRVVRA